jgi:hypothetical protein
MHTDPALMAASSKTAERGIKVLKSLLDNPIMKGNCIAIYAASIGEKDMKHVDAERFEVRMLMWYSACRLESIAAAHSYL